MITPPTNWETLWSALDSKLEVSLLVYLTTGVTVDYRNNDLSNVSVSGALFSDFSIGNACSARLSFSLKDGQMEFVQFKRLQKVYARCRLVSLDGGTTTAWVDIGTYYIDSFTLNDSGNVSVTAYDEIYFMQDMVSQQTADLTVTAYMNRINSMYGLNASYDDFLSTSCGAASMSIATVGELVIPAACSDVPAREVLASIAGLAGGNIAITKGNVYKLYRAMDSPSTTNYVPSDYIPITAASVHYSDRLKTVTGVVVQQSGNTKQNSTGWNMVVNIGDKFTVTSYKDTDSNNNTVWYITRNAHRNTNTGWFQYNMQYSDVLASGVFISPLFELGDFASVKVGDGYYNFPIAEYNLNMSGGFWGSVSFPISDNAIIFKYSDTWQSGTHWYNDWFTIQLNYPNQIATPTVEVISSHMFAFKRVLFKNNPTVVRFQSGLTSISTTITYTNDAGETKTATISGRLAEQICPYLISPTSPTTGWVDYIYFYSNNIPEDAIGKIASSSTFQMRTSDSTSTSGTLITVQATR